MKLLTFAVTLVFLQTAVALASPTSNEFRACHQISSKLLQQCLDDAPGSPSEECWSRAKRANDACYAQVKHSHRSDEARISAMKEAEAKKGNPRE